eukprot:364637-Chlamydomonas_euryale.AAC.3
MYSYEHRPRQTIHRSRSCSHLGLPARQEPPPPAKAAAPVGLVAALAVLAARATQPEHAAAAVDATAPSPHTIATALDLERLELDLGGAQRIPNHQQPDEHFGQLAGAELGRHLLELAFVAGAHEPPDKRIDRVERLGTRARRQLAQAVSRQPAEVLQQLSGPARRCRRRSRRRGSRPSSRRRRHAVHVWPVSRCRGAVT